LILSFLLTAWGIFSMRQTPVDALPDLSDVQVIIKTSFPGQAPQVVEDQVTYPLTTAMLSVPKAINVRVTRTSTSFLRMVPICIGRAPAYLNT
jgi:Cu(I)/Ag(I) efflux system membrane protein CusA/SilA